MKGLHYAFVAANWGGLLLSLMGSNYVAAFFAFTAAVSHQMWWREQV